MYINIGNTGIWPWFSHGLFWFVTLLNIRRTSAQNHAWPLLLIYIYAIVQYLEILLLFLISGLFYYLFFKPDNRTISLMR